MRYTEHLFPLCVTKLAGKAQIFFLDILESLKKLIEYDADIVFQYMACFWIKSIEFSVSAEVYNEKCRLDWTLWESHLGLMDVLIDMNEMTSCAQKRKAFFGLFVIFLS